MLKNGRILCVCTSAPTLIGCHILSSHQHSESLSSPHPGGPACATAVLQQKLQWQISTRCRASVMHFVYHSPSPLQTQSLVTEDVQRLFDGFRSSCQNKMFEYCGLGLDLYLHTFYICFILDCLLKDEHVQSPRTWAPFFCELLSCVIFVILRELWRLEGTQAHLSLWTHSFSPSLSLVISLSVSFRLSTSLSVSACAKWCSAKL